MKFASYWLLSCDNLYHVSVQGSYPFNRFNPFNRYSTDSISFSLTTQIILQSSVEKLWNILLNLAWKHTGLKEIRKKSEKRKRCLEMIWDDVWFGIWREDDFERSLERASETRPQGCLAKWEWWVVWRRITQEVTDWVLYESLRRSPTPLGAPYTFLPEQWPDSEGRLPPKRWKKRRHREEGYCALKHLHNPAGNSNFFQ